MVWWLALALACGDKDPSDSGTPDEGDADTDSDADSDADSDSDADLDSVDWSHCPDASAYVGDSDWEAVLEADDGAVYCSAWNEDRTLEDELAALGMMRIVEGSWALPADEGDHELSLPVCFARPEGLPRPLVDSSGQTTVSTNTWSGTTYTYLQGTQDLTDADGVSWILAHTLVLVGNEGEAPLPLPADGNDSDEETGAGLAFAVYGEGGSVYDTDALKFSTCSQAWWEKNVHTVSFDGGDVHLELFLGDNITATAPGRFALAEGTLDGTAFSVTERFQLVYSPDHHHFSRAFAVRFDAPIGDACALRVEGLDGVDDGITATVSLADCELAVIETREVSAEGFTLGE